MLNLQDFSLVNTTVRRTMDENEFMKMADAFYLIAIGNILDLQDDDIIDSITDHSFLKAQGEEGGFDRGVDAIYIDESKETPIVHIFNCKYTEKFEKSRGHNFPSGEIDKIADYFRMLMNKDEQTINDSNAALRALTEEIWQLFSTKYPSFEIHLCSNMENGLEITEKKRFESIINMYSNVSVKEHTLSSYVEAINGENREFVDAKFRANGKELFEKTDGDIRALIVNIRADELMRMITSNTALRENLEVEDFSVLHNETILEDIFYDNVRVYKKQKSSINKSIADTAKSDQRNKFFYYNNGITITCHSFNYPQKIPQPVVTLEKFQVVNGSQTLHALFEVAKENPEFLSDIEILCRIYELKQPTYSSKIAEYTNSQNPVTTRDIRSIDYVQQKLESELLINGYFYERKKNQYEGKAKKKRIDAEKAGQALMAFYNKMPNEAKNDKGLIFGSKYDLVFNEDITSNKVLLAYSLYCDIEERKREARKAISLDKNMYDTHAYILHASYYFLYIMRVIADINISNGIIEGYDKNSVMGYYDLAAQLIKKSIVQEKRNNAAMFNNADYFKSSRPKTYIDDYFRRLGNEITTEKITALKMVTIS